MTTEPPIAPPTSLKVLFLTPELDQNSLGRTYSLWLLTEYLGWSSDVISTRGASIWAPLAGTPFADRCSLVSETAGSGDLLARARDADLIIAVKPLAASFGLALDLSTTSGVPILLDIDDPDLDAVLSWRTPLRRAAKSLFKRDVVRRARVLRAHARSVERIVSNPWLQARHGGVVVPHARTIPPAGSPHTSRTPEIAFIGTTRRHKGLHVLRKATTALRERGFSLTISASRPADAEAWENWVGTTSLSDGIKIVGRADIVVIPSLAAPFAFGQLPAKLVDAMLAGRAIAVSNIEPMPWALAGTGKTFRAGSSRALAAALSDLEDPATRQALGDAARKRAVETFSVTACAPAFEAAARRAVERRTSA